MAITMHGNGGMTIEGKESMALYQMLALRGALRLELVGMRRRGRSAYSIAKRQFGLRGNKQRVYDQLCALCEAQSAKVIRVVEVERERAEGRG